MKKQIPKEIKETSFNYVDVDNIASFTTYERRWINKIKKWEQDYPDKVKVVAENEDGTVCVHLPKQWFKVSPPKKVSDEHRERMRELGKKMTADKIKKKAGGEED